MSDPSNPFAGLLGIPEAKPANNTEFNDGSASLQIASKNTQEEEETETVNNIVENVFHFTINSDALDRHPGTERQLVVLEELAEAMKPRIHIDLEALEQALFERLLLPNPESCIIPKTCRNFKDHVIQTQVFPYLFSSMQNLQSYDQVKSPCVKNAIQKMRELIFRNAVTALKQPALFEGQNFAVQLVELLQHVDPQSQTFFIDVVEAFVADSKYEHNLNYSKSCSSSMLYAKIFLK